MKKIIYAAALLLAGCTSGVPDYVTECPNGDIYKRHAFNYVSYNTDINDLYTYECKNCGLLCKWGNLECKSHYGVVYIYKSKNTGKFDLYVLHYMEDDVQKYMLVNKNDVKKVNYE